VATSSRLSQFAVGVAFNALWIAAVFRFLFRSPFSISTLAAFAICVACNTVIRIYAIVLRPLRPTMRKTLMTATPLRLTSSAITLVALSALAYGLITRGDLPVGAPWLLVIWSGYGLRFGNWARVVRPAREWSVFPVAFGVGTLVSVVGCVVPLLGLSELAVGAVGVIVSLCVLATIPELEGVARWALADPRFSGATAGQTGARQ
jgi:hypothetical protein